MLPEGSVIQTHLGTTDILNIQCTDSLNNVGGQQASSLCLNIRRKKISGSTPVSGGCLIPDA